MGVPEHHVSFNAVALEQICVVNEELIVWLLKFLFVEFFVCALPPLLFLLLVDIKVKHGNHFVAPQGKILSVFFPSSRNPIF